MSISTHTATGRILRNVGISFGLAACILTMSCADDGVMGDDEKYMPVRDCKEDEEDCLPNDDQELEPNDCDLSGTWMAQIFTVSQALGVLKAESHNWFYYELDDQGDDVVVERSLDCGFVVCGAATQIELTPEQTAGLSLRNRQDGILNTDPNDMSQPATEAEKVAPRKITYKKLPDGTCEFSMERWWSVRSAPSSYLPPRDQYSSLSIGNMQANNPLPPKDNPPQIETGGDWDVDGDGKIGINLQLDKPTSGWRDAIQRDWNEVPTTYIADGMSDFTVPANFDNEETVYDVSTSILDQVSVAMPTGNNIRFVRIDEEAPDTMNELLQFCTEQVAEHFHKEVSTNYCDLRKQRLNDGFPKDDEDGGSDD